MKILGTSVKTLAAASLLTLGMAGSAVVSASTTLVVGTWMPPSNPMNSTALPTWAGWVEEATEGRVRVRIEQGLGNPASFYQMVEDGVMNAGWSFHGYLPGRFSLPMAVEQPGLGVNAEAASAALWQVHEKYFAKADQYEGLELLGLFTHGPGQIHTREPINSLADLRNKRIRIGGGVQATLGQRMGVSAVSAPGPQVYEMLQQGVADGVFMPAGEQRSSRLAEVAPNLTLLPGGMYLGSFAFFIDPEFMASLSPRDADAIRKVSGYKFSVMAGKAWDQDDVDGIAFARAQGGNVVELPENHAIVRDFRQMIKGMDDAWVDSVKRTGVDARKALADLRRIAHEYAAKN